MRNIILLMAMGVSVNLSAMLVTPEGRDLANRLGRLKQEEIALFRLKLQEVKDHYISASQAPKLVREYMKLDPKTDDQKWVDHSLAVALEGIAWYKKKYGSTQLKPQETATNITTSKEEDTSHPQLLPLNLRTSLDKVLGSVSPLPKRPANDEHKKSDA